MKVGNGHVSRAGATEHGKALVQELHDSMKSGCLVAVAMLSDVDRKRRELYWHVIAKDVKRQHKHVAKRVKNSADGAELLEEQLSGKGMSPVVAMINNLSDVSALQDVGFVIETSFDLEGEDDTSHHPIIAAENEWFMI